MEKYIALDVGKFATKASEYKPETDSIRKFHFVTKVGGGDLRDDAIESHTVVAEIDGKVYKVGQGARGAEASKDTSKLDDIHKICALVAIASFCSAKEKDEVNVAFGIPADEWADVPTREKYRSEFLPDGDITVKIKIRSDAPVMEKKFTIKKKFVFPESLGALLMDDSPEVRPNTYTGVLDIGNLNLNATEWMGTELVQEDSITQELGGSILISEMARELKTALRTRCNEKCVAEALFDGDPDDRHLEPMGAVSEERKKEIVDTSRQIMAKCLASHASEIKSACDAKGWSLELMRIIVIGGTGALLEKELKAVFGNVTVLENAEYCNSFGYLRMMCAKIPSINKVIPLTEMVAMPQAKAEPETAADAKGA